MWPVDDDVVFLAGVGKDHVVGSQIEVHQAIPRHCLFDIGLELDEIGEVVERPLIEPREWMFSEPSPMAEQRRMCLEARLERYVSTDLGQPVDHEDQAIHVLLGERRGWHAPVDPLNHQGNPVTVVDDADQARCRYEQAASRPEPRPHGRCKPGADRVEAESLRP